MVQFERTPAVSEERGSAPEDVLSCFSRDLEGLIEEVADRVVTDLDQLVADTALARAIIAGKSLWRAHLVLGLAQRSGTLTARHIDVAIAIELLDIAFDTHLLGTMRRAGPYRLDAEVNEGAMILAGDFYLTRAAIVALRSDRIETLRQVAAIMGAIPSGHLLELEQPRQPGGVIRQYVRSRRYLYGKVAVACLRASLSESGIAESCAARVDMLAALTASAISSRRDWIQRAANPLRPDWDLPLLVALRAQPLERRNVFFQQVVSHSGQNESAIEREIADTRALSTCGHLAQHWASGAAAALQELFPVSSIGLRIPVVRTATARP
jgi:hypothetical protein